MIFATVGSSPVKCGGVEKQNRGWKVPGKWTTPAGPESYPTWNHQIWWCSTYIAICHIWSGDGICVWKMFASGEWYFAITRSWKLLKHCLGKQEAQPLDIPIPIFGAAFLVKLMETAFEIQKSSQFNWVVQVRLKQSSKERVRIVIKPE